MLLDRMGPEELKNLFSPVGVPVLVVLGLIALFLAWLAIRTIRLRAVSGTEGMVGLSGIVRKVSVFRGFVLVEVRGELWWARCGSRLEPGEEIVISDVDGMLLRVETAGGFRASEQS